MNSETAVSIPNVREAKRILCVQGHYDDNDGGAGGTIAALAAGGATIIYLTVTDDLVGVVDPAMPDEQAAAQLKREQEEAGEIIGVSEQYWLGYPDAGEYDYFELRQRIIKYIRQLRPDFVFTLDPWLPYEAHMDHIRTGLATAEAVYLQSFVRLPVDPEVDKTYEPYDVAGIALYATHKPNIIFDISDYMETKRQAFACYNAQFTPEGLERVLGRFSRMAEEWAVREEFTHGEPLKVLTRNQLHGGETVRMMMHDGGATTGRR